MMIEGVWYTRYLVIYRSTSGKRRTKRVWCPGRPWLRETVVRALDARGDVRPGTTVRVTPETA